MELAIELNLAVGDKINILSSAYISTPFGGLPKQETYFIAGIFSSGFYEFDKSVVFLNLEETLYFFDRTISDINLEIFLSNPLKADDIKDKILSLKNGVFKWKKMQSLAYSDLISSAVPMQGVFDFIKKCDNHNIDFYIVSHKTEYAEITTSGNNLRDMALEWLSKNFAHHKLTLPLDNIYFSHTREDKINTIKSVSRMLN